MTADARARAAQTILEAPLAAEVLADFEAAAINLFVHAPINDDDTRRNAAAEVRAIRRFRERLEALAKGQSERPRQPPA